MRYLKTFEEISFSNLFKRKKDKENEDKENEDKDKVSVSSEINFFIDKEPYDKSQFGQNKHKVYLFKDNKVYYLGDIRKFKDGKSLSYLRLDNIKPVKIYEIEYMRDLNKEEKEILDKELDRIVIERDLMSDVITYREKIVKEL